MTSRSEETQARRPERDGSSEASGSVTLGLLPAPEMPERIASDLADELPELLGRHIDERVCWSVPVVSDPLTGDWRDAPEILDETYERMQQEGWD